MLEGTLVRRAAGRIKRGAARRLRPRTRLRQLRAQLQLRGRVSRVLGLELPRDYGRPFFPDASFNEWVRRLDAGRPVLYPPSWRSHGRLVIDEPARVAVLLHVHFPELVDELIDQLGTIPVPFDLIVTNSSGAELDIRPVPGMRNCRVLPVQNHGRDIWPTVAAVNSGVLDPYLLDPQGAHQEERLAGGARGARRRRRHLARRLPRAAARRPDERRAHLLRLPRRPRARRGHRRRERPGCGVLGRQPAQRARAGPSAGVRRWTTTP